MKTACRAQESLAGCLLFEIAYIKISLVRSHHIPGTVFILTKCRGQGVPGLTQNYQGRRVTSFPFFKCAKLMLRYRFRKSDLFHQIQRTVEHFYNEKRLALA